MVEQADYNTERVRDMCIAAKVAQESNDIDGDAHRRFRTFTFVFANTFLHELGHLFVTFLNQGHTVTPPHIQACVMGVFIGDRGEAGPRLEQLIFGGIVDYLRGSAKDDRQVRSPLPSLLKGRYLACLLTYGSVWHTSLCQGA